MIIRLPSNGMSGLGFMRGSAITLRLPSSRASFDGQTRAPIDGQKQECAEDRGRAQRDEGRSAPQQRQQHESRRD